MQRNSSDTSSLRLLGIGIVVLSLFATLFTRALYLQVMNTSTFQAEATANQVRLVYTEAPRGRLLDRNGRILVDNETVQAITVQRRAVVEDKKLIPKLSALLGVGKKELMKRVNDARYSNFRPIPIALDVDEETSIYIREHQDELPGVESTQVARRSYPHKTMAAHVLGYVGEINDTELKAHKGDDYRLGDDVGKAGAEKTFEKYLRGKPGIAKLEVNSKGRVIRTLAETPPVPGHDVRLSIDLDTQKVAEDSLQQGLGAAHGVYDKDSGRGFHAPAGSVVVLDPDNGQVLAMASYPTYDPSEFIGGISSDLFKNLTDPAAYSPLNNRAIQGEYAPGSTFKLVTSLAALSKGLISSGTTVVDTGKYKIPNCTGKCEFKNAGGHQYGPVDVTHAIAYSSDVFFYGLGAQFWFGRDKYGEAIQDEAEKLGLGKPTGINLSAEHGGRVPTPETRKRDHEDNPTAFPEGRWFVGDNVNLAVGQGEMLITPLQLANLYGTFANGGTIYRPQIGAEVVDEDGKILHSFARHANGKIDIPQSVSDPITAGLQGVTTFGEGTATAAFSGFDQSVFHVIGKTGTAQVHNKQDTALFASVGYKGSKKYAISVVMEEAGFGGVAAAPVSRRIYEQLSGGKAGSISVGSGAD